MNIVVNEPLVNRRAKLGRIASLLGLAILAGGMVASFQEKLLYVSFAALILGFIVSQVGSYNTIRWGRKPRSDQLLVKALKGLDNRFSFYHYYLPASHVLIGPTGLFVFLTKFQGGQVGFDGRRWREKKGMGRILLFFGQESLGNPTAELQLEVQQLAKLISEKQPDLNPTIRGVVVFVNPKVELTLNEPTVPVLKIKQLKPYVRRPLQDNGYLKGDERRALIEIFDQIVQEAGGQAVQDDGEPDPDQE
jgi:hypothetical protein